MSRSFSNPVEKMQAEERAAADAAYERRIKTDPAFRRSQGIPSDQMLGPDGNLYRAESALDAHFIRCGAYHLVPAAGPLR